MTFEQWIEKYKPISEDGDPILYEAIAKKPETIKTEDMKYTPFCGWTDNPRCIWTDIYCEDGHFINSGWHFVNRNGYYITEIPFEEDFIQVTISRNEPDEDNESE